MKRIPAFLLLLVLSLVGTMSAKPQRIVRKKTRASLKRRSRSNRSS